MELKGWQVPLLVMLAVLIGATFTSQNLIPGGGIMDSAGQPQLNTTTNVNLSASGVTTLVASQGAGVKIRVNALVCGVGSTTTINLAGSTTVLTASLPILASTTLLLPFSPMGWVTTMASEPITIVQNPASVTGCSVIWMPTS